MDRPAPESGAQAAVRWQGWHSLSLLALVAALLASRLVLPATPRLWTWLTTLGLLLLFALISGHGVTGLWLGVLIDSRNKASLSRLQLLLWTGVILAAYLTAVLVNLDGGHPAPLAVTIPPELWLLMGISTTSLVGSPLLLRVKQAQPVTEETRAQALRQLARQAVDTSKVLLKGEVVMNATPEAAQLADLFRGSQVGDAGQLDLGKLQLFFFTLVLLLAYGAALAALFGREAGAILSLPAPEAGTLALLGISHAGYLASKATPAERRRP
jgi:hypothetical protein